MKTERLTQKRRCAAALLYERVAEPLQFSGHVFVLHGRCTRACVCTDPPFASFRKKVSNLAFTRYAFLGKLAREEFF